MAKYGRWEIIESIDEGGQGHIFLVRDSSGEHTGDHILKRLKNIKRIGRFEQEIKAGLQLQHPRIAPIIDWSLDPKEKYFVTKYFSGKTLDNAGRQNPLDALSIFIDLCETVNYAHSNGIIHRDLKPENIVFDENKNPIVLDFGICYFEDEDKRLTTTTEAVGSKFYIAPELEDGRYDEVTTAVDSYSLGKILYFLVSGDIFAREKYHGANSLAVKMNNPQLDYITQRILAKSVIQESSQRLTASQLKEEAEKIRRLIGGGFYPGKVDSICRFCGEGIYKSLSYAGLKSYISVQDGAYTYPADQYMTCEIIRCNECGHLQFFNQDRTNIQ